MVVSHWPLMNVILAGASASPSNWTDLPCQCIKLVGKRQLGYAAYQGMQTRMTSIGKRIPLLASNALHTRREKALSIGEKAA